MGCCGQGRAALRAGAIRNSSPSVVGTPAATVLRYLGGKQVRIRGAVSGRLYEFIGGERTAVEPRDVPTMVRTGLFGRD